MEEKRCEIRNPLLDELEKGKWPSFVKDMKQAAKRSPWPKISCASSSLSYKEKIGHWKHGASWGSKATGGSDRAVFGRPDLFRAWNTSTRCGQPPTGWFYDTKTLRTLCDVWISMKRVDEHARVHGRHHPSGTKTENLQPCFDDLSDAGFDLGGSGSPSGPQAPA